MMDFEQKAREIVSEFKSRKIDEAFPSYYPDLLAAISSALEEAVRQSRCHASDGASGDSLSASPLQTAIDREAQKKAWMPLMRKAINIGHRYPDDEEVQEVSKQLLKRLDGEASKRMMFHLKNELGRSRSKEESNV